MNSYTVVNKDLNVKIFSFLTSHKYSLALGLPWDTHCKTLEKIA